RPWIVPTGYVHVGFLNGDIPIGSSFPICVGLRNTGQTPAAQVTIVMCCFGSAWTDPWPTGNPMPNGMEAHTIGSIGPGVEHRQWGASGNLVLTQAPRDALFVHGSSRFTICGYVEYRDK